jgi:hypothetical protein
MLVKERQLSLVDLGRPGGAVVDLARSRRPGDVLPRAHQQALRHRPDGREAGEVANGAGGEAVPPTAVV